MFKGKCCETNYPFEQTHIGTDLNVLVNRYEHFTNKYEYFTNDCEYFIPYIYVTDVNK
jgi:hypothetical protein